MGMCGPAEPCAPCREVYAKDPRYVLGPPGGDAFVIASDKDRRKRHGRRHTVLATEDRVPVRTGSRASARRARLVKRRRRS